MGKFIDVEDIRRQFNTKDLPIPGPLANMLSSGNESAAEMWLRNHVEHPLCQPYLVHLYVQDSRFSLDLRPVAYLIRSTRLNPALDDRDQPGPPMAGHIAEALWQKWERPKSDFGGMPPAFPDTTNKADVTAIDEGDWKEFLDQAHRFAKTMFCYGSPRFPFWWTSPDLPFKDYMHVHDHEHHDLLGAYHSELGYDSAGNAID